MSLRGAARTAAGALLAAACALSAGCAGAGGGGVQAQPAVEEPPAAPAQVPLAPAPVAAPATEREAEPLARALESVQEHHLRADLYFLASDELGGRGTPSLGQRVAARFLQARMERLGWSPAAEHGWLHTFELSSRRIPAGGARGLWRSAAGERPMVYARDFGIHPSDVTGGTWSGGLVFAGAGREADFQGLDLAGRWAVCAGQGRQRNASRWAAAAGAVGLLILPGPAGEALEPPLADWDQRLQRAFPRWPAARESSAPPVLWLSGALSRELLAASGLAELPAVGTPLQGELSASVAGAGTIELENVCALLPGVGPLAHEVVIVSAHYDHVGTSARTGEIYNGADDNASGTAGLLAIAEALAAHGPLERSVMLMWVSAEELGLLGSRAWTEKPWLPEGLRAVANLNIDMIGRNAPDEAHVTPSPEHPERNRIAVVLEAALRAEGFGRIVDGDVDWDRSDHAMFAKNMGLPVAFVSDGEHEDYHQPSDTAEKIDYDKLRRCVRAVVRTLVDLQQGPIERVDGAGTR